MSQSSSEPTAPRVTVLSEESYELGEGARAVDGVTFVDLLAGRLLRHPGTVGGEVEPVLSVDVPLGAVAPVAGEPGRRVAALGDGIALLDAAGSVEWLARPEEHAPAPTRMNDGVCDAEGRFWAGSMAYDGESPLGSLYRTDPDGTVTRVVEDLAIANGPAVSADGRLLFLADSAQHTITRYALAEDGHLSDGTVVVRTGEEGVPDGMTTDAEGTLWVAVHGAGEVRRYDADGYPLLTVTLPAAQPTSVTIVPGGLVVTTAAEGMEAPGPADGRLLRVDLDDAPTAVPVREFGPRR
ncbi:SMP-30/gluconolactonase/LRE family protein [Aquipuribacter hungaricus]|uniref:SMP-30/gluconolactonase/LRE family protein n=1 Tax=Aquipuribacter hungaricus TaxID=545624 RepID=A0ABV7WM15_9MICO